MSLAGDYIQGKEEKKLCNMLLKLWKIDDIIVYY